MNAVVEAFVAEDFFAPAPTDLIDSLVARYQFERKRIGEVAEFSRGDVCRAVLHYFLKGNATEDRGRISMEMSATQLFCESGAVASLNATYWQEALNLTDVYDAMPQDRRNQWSEQIRNPQGVKKNRSSDEWETPPLPDFEDKTVRATLMDLLGKRTQFLAERVDGIFRALSGEHVTNSPAAFGKRMIIAYLFNSYDTANHDRIGYINDLRCVIAKFMGRDEPAWYASSEVVRVARRDRRGEWVTLDGGALRLRAYKCGTAHLEVHPDMAWRLNQILAHLYPMAIPPEFRTKPKRKTKGFTMMGRPLPFAVIELLSSLKEEPTTLYRDRWTPPKPGRTQNPNAKRFDYRSDVDKAVRAEAERVIEYIGGVKMTQGGGDWFEFDYNADAVISEIVCSGCIPDQRAHQFYPTPANVAEAAVEMAQIGSTDECLEPSAGTGNLADLMPKGRTYCVEISNLHSEILRAKGYQVATMDFLQFRGSYDRIVMNPPFSEGRWQAHIEHAATLLNDGGRLVAIVPASARGKDVLPGFSITWSDVMNNEFANTSIAVAVMTAERVKP
jgi:hypothetical protein